MAKPGSGGGLVRYYCTAGNGMERFLMEEAKKKLAAEDVCQMPGKVLFSSSAGIDSVSELKAAERLFLLLKQDSPVLLSTHTSPAKAASLLQSRLLGDSNQWTSAVMTWSRLQGELADRRTTVNTPSARRVMTGEGGKEGRRSEQDKCDVESGKSSEEQREEDRGNERWRNGEPNGAQKVEKKRKRNDEAEEEERGEGEENKCRENSKHGATLRTDFNDRDHATPGRGHSVERRDTHERLENAKTAEGRDETLQQPSETEPETPSVPVSFRISCKCTGSLSRYFSSQEVSKVIGVGLSRLLGWKADLKNPQLEVNVYLSDDHCLAGIPLTRLPLANRRYIKTTGLRSTVAWAMASLAQIQPGFCVVDPMCGVGTILIEAAQEQEAACFLGVDIDDGQLLKANENIAFADLGKRIHLLKASSMALPLPSACVDAVVCDLPFGRKFGTKANMAANLPLILTEMERVLCIGGTLVLLLSPQLSCLLKKLLAQTDTGPSSNEETKPPTGTQDCPSPSVSSTSQQTFQIHQGDSSPCTQKTGCLSGSQHSLPPPLSSLKHQETVRVSLGMIDGLIHKYVKKNS